MVSRRSAKDAAELADHLQLKRCVLLCWSTGVQARSSGCGAGVVVGRDRRVARQALTPVKGDIHHCQGPLSLTLRQDPYIHAWCGCQIGLQLALDRPELVTAMVLIQGRAAEFRTLLRAGTTGEAMKALLQPICQVPGCRTGDLGPLVGVNMNL